MKTRVGILGTGRMGSALARAFIKNGYPTTVWNRSPDKTQPLAALGASVAASVRDAVAASEIIVVNVSDYEASTALLRDPPAAEALRGKVIVELTSGTPRSAREAALWAEAQGAHTLDGAILATPDIIGSAAATIIVSGPQAAFEVHQEALKVLGTVRHVGEDPGIAAALESVGLSQLWGGLFAALQTIALAQAEGVDPALLARQWKETGSVVDGLVADLIARTQSRRFAADQDTLSTVVVHANALRHLVEVTEMHQLDPGLVATYDAQFQRAIAAGHLDDDFAAMTKFTQISKAGSSDAPKAADGRSP